MRIFKFVFGGLFMLFMVSIILKALFFLTFAAMLGGIVFMIRKAFMRQHGPVGFQTFHPMKQYFLEKQLQSQAYQYPIVSLDELVNRQEFSVPAEKNTGYYRSIDLI